MELKTVLIGVQSRSTSDRLPGKCFEMIGDKMLLDHVLDACKSAAFYLNRHTAKTGVAVKVALLIPFRDRIESEFGRRCQIIQGPEHDVLSRFKSAAEISEANLIVRITGDCPMIPPYLISKHIKLALANGYDYVSNGDENYRTALDGMDCEVISRRMLDYVDATAKTPYDREHVTTLARREPPSWAKMGYVAGFFDFSDVKLSVDTPEDLERVRVHYERLNKKLSGGEKRYGKQYVHRI